MYISQISVNIYLPTIFCIGIRAIKFWHKRAVQELDLVSDFFDYTVSEDIENATHNMHGMQDMHGMHDMEIEMEMGEMYMKAGVDAKYLRAPAHLALVALVYHLPFFVLGLAGWFTRYWHNNNPTRAILVIFSSIYHLTLSFMSLCPMYLQPSQVGMFQKTWAWSETSVQIVLQFSRMNKCDMQWSIGMRGYVLYSTEVHQSFLGWRVRATKGSRMWKF